MSNVESLVGIPFEHLKTSLLLQNGLNLRLAQTPGKEQIGKWVGRVGIGLVR